MGIQQICSRSVDTAEANESIQRTAERMNQRTVGALVVVDRARIPIGIVTDRDLVTRALAKWRDPDRTTVAEVMTVEPKVLTVEASIEEALDVMQRGAFRRLPIVDARGQLAGIVTLDDIVRFYAKQFFGVAFLLARETPEMAAIPKSRLGA